MYQQQPTDQICDMIALRKFQSLQIATFVFLQIIANNCFLTAIIDCKLQNLNQNFVIILEIQLLHFQLPRSKQAKKKNTETFP